jgi:hypothetical protein
MSFKNEARGSCQHHYPGVSSSGESSFNRICSTPSESEAATATLYNMTQRKEGTYATAVPRPFLAPRESHRRASESDVAWATAWSDSRPETSDPEFQIIGLERRHHHSIIPPVLAETESESSVRFTRASGRKHHTSETMIAAADAGLVMTSRSNIIITRAASVVTSGDVSREMIRGFEARGFVRLSPDSSSSKAPTTSGGSSFDRTSSTPSESEVARAARYKMTQRTESKVVSPKSDCKIGIDGVRGKMAGTAPNKQRQKSHTHLEGLSGKHARTPNSRNSTTHSPFLDDRRSRSEPKIWPVRHAGHRVEVICQEPKPMKGMWDAADDDLNVLVRGRSVILKSA